MRIPRGACPHWLIRTPLSTLVTSDRVKQCAMQRETDPSFLPSPSALRPKNYITFKRGGRRRRDLGRTSVRPSGLKRSAADDDDDDGGNSENESSAVVVAADADELRTGFVVENDDDVASSSTGRSGRGYGSALDSLTGGEAGASEAIKALSRAVVVAW